MGLTSVTRPFTSVERSTEARTAARTPSSLGYDARQRLDLVLGPVDGDDVDQRGDGLLGRGRHANGVQATRQQTRLDLHDLAVDLAHDVVALARRRDDRADNVCGAAGEAQALVGADELAQLLKALVQAGVLGGRGQVRYGGGVRATLSDGGFRRVVGGVVVEVGDGLDEAVGVAGAGHADLLARHELERAVRAEMQHGVGLEDLLDVRVVGGEAVVGRSGLRVEQAHGIALVAEGRLHADEDVAEGLAVDEQVLAVAVEVAGRRPPVLLEVGGIGRELLVLGHRHLVGNVELGRRDARLLVVQDFVDEGLDALGQLAHLVALP
eukprot:scaffold6585_cov34-Phaeocystis_antarctica.AAC.1